MLDQIDQLHRLNSEVDHEIAKLIQSQKIPDEDRCTITSSIDKENSKTVIKKCTQRSSETEMNALRKSLEEQLNLNSELKLNLKSLKDDKKKLESDLIKLRGIISKSNTSVDVKDFEITKSENSRLRKEVSNLRELVQIAEKKSIERETKLKRAIDDMNKMKADLVEHTNSKGKDINLDDTVTRLKNHIRELESQKKELILGFKKQMQLIDILKKQKENLETLIKLDIVDKDFTAALELGSNLERS